MGVTCCLEDSSSTISMKYFILALAAVGAVSATGAVTGDECQTAASDLVDRLLSEESIAEQIAILKLVVCPQLPADIDCEGLLDAEFLAMATCIYNEFILNQDVCGRLGLCYKENKLTQVRDWTCDSARTSWQELLSSWDRRTPSPKLLHTFKETATVVKMVTPLNAQTLLQLFFHWLFQSLEMPSMNNPLNCAKKLSESANFSLSFY